jgi:hypothetical protein
MKFAGSAQRVIHTKRDRRADRDDAEDRETDDFLAALGVRRAKGQASADAQAQQQQPPRGSARFRT